MANHRFKAALAATALLLAAPLPALAQSQGAEQHHGQSDARPAAPAEPGAGMMQGMPQVRMSEDTMMPMGGGETDTGMMDCPMMSEMMRTHPGMMTMMMQMHPEMMRMMEGRMGAGGEMMRQGPAPGTMMGQDPASGRMMRRGPMGWDAGVVTPIQHLSTDDVRHYFEHRLEGIGNDRLKVGEVTQADDDTITVDIVTVDNSLVDRLEVDPHSGRIERAE
jgi:hypothetical protein